MINKALHIILLCFLMTSASQVSGQTFMGKRFTASVGTSLGLPLLTELIIRRHGNSLTRSNITVFPPEIEVSLGVALSSSLNLNFRSSYYGLPDVVTQYRSSGWTSYSHSFLLRTSAFDVGAELKLFYEYAPIGKYVSIGGMYCMASGTVYGTLSKTMEDIDFNDVEEPQIEIVKLEPWSVQRNCFGISIGKGKVQQLSRMFILDYGIKSSFFFGSRSFNIQYDPTNDNSNYDYKENFTEGMQSLMMGALRSSYLVEIYLHFGISL